MRGFLAKNQLHSLCAQRRVRSSAMISCSLSARFCFMLHAPGREQRDRCHPFPGLDFGNFFPQFRDPFDDRAGHEPRIVTRRVPFRATTLRGRGGPVLHKFSLALRGSAPTPVEPFSQNLEADSVCETATTRRNLALLRRCRDACQVVQMPKLRQPHRVRLASPNLWGTVYPAAAVSSPRALW